MVVLTSSMSDRTYVSRARAGGSPRTVGSGARPNPLRWLSEVAASIAVATIGQWMGEHQRLLICHSSRVGRLFIS